MDRRSTLALLAAALPVPFVVCGAAAQAAPRLRFEVFQGKGSGFRWRLKSGNGQIVATSGEGYKTKAGCMEAIGLVQRGAAAATVDDLT
ncbi:MAG TPA: DUF1508 domain-containing protein [Gemmatimonadales bacterium]|nr:DUF1508 domain-containing protein [Gemmatimonadales bacterium]